MILVPVAVAVASFVIYRLVASSLRERAFQRFAREHKCQTPLDTTKTWPQTLAQLKRLSNTRTSGEDLIDDIIVRQYDDANTYTHRNFDGSWSVATAEPANLQAMLGTQFKDYATGERRYQALAPVLGRSIFSSDGAFWEHSRALFRPQFSRENINDLEATNTAAETLIRAANFGTPDASEWTEEVDMLPLLYNLTLDTATDFLFGQSVESQAAGIRKKEGSTSEEGIQSIADQASSQQLREDFEVLGAMLQRRIQLMFLYWLGDGFRFRKAISNAHAFAGHFVKLAIASTKAEQNAGYSADEKPQRKKDHLLLSLVAQTQDLKELQNQTLAILFAGRDTTAALLSWCIVRLCLHPEVFTNLRSAVLQDFGTVSDDEPIAFSKLKACRYLQHFINEVLRLNSIVPFNARVAVRDTILPTGGGPDQLSPVSIRKGEVVMYSVYVMHRRKDLWGDDALDFRPERWQERTIPAWQYLPFSGGPRICLGQQFGKYSGTIFPSATLR